MKIGLPFRLNPSAGLENKMLDPCNSTWTVLPSRCGLPVTEQTKSINSKRASIVKPIMKQTQFTWLIELLQKLFEVLCNLPSNWPPNSTMDFSRPGV
jgi:hypothetical protein